MGPSDGSGLADVWDWVTAITFSQDGRLLAPASFDKTVRVWDPATAAALQTLKGRQVRVLDIAFSYGGTLLASASADKTVRLWEPATRAAKAAESIAIQLQSLITSTSIITPQARKVAFPLPHKT
jgi:WD40 repeat protein